MTVHIEKKNNTYYELYYHVKNNIRETRTIKLHIDWC